MERKICEESCQESIYAILQKISLLGGLTKDQLKMLFGLMETMEVIKEDFVFHQGGSPDNIYIVLDGHISIVEELSDGSTERLTCFKEGECFGETELIGIFPYLASALAMKDTKLLVVSKKSFFDIYKKDTALFSHLILNIARETARRLAEADIKMFKYLEDIKQRKVLDKSFF